MGVELPHGSAGGGSDGNFTGAMGIPTLDGLGVRGADAHTLNEHIEVDSLAERGRLMAGLAGDAGVITRHWDAHGTGLAEACIDDGRLLRSRWHENCRQMHVTLRNLRDSFDERTPLDRTARCSDICFAASSPPFP